MSLQTEREQKTRDLEKKLETLSQSEQVCIELHASMESIVSVISISNVLLYYIAYSLRHEYQQPSLMLVVRMHKSLQRNSHKKQSSVLQLKERQWIYAKSYRHFELPGCEDSFACVTNG